MYEEGLTKVCRDDRTLVAGAANAERNDVG